MVPRADASAHAARPRRAARRTRATIVVGTVAAAAMTATILPIVAADDALTLRPVADTTVTQVPQDGDTSARTTLASCPELCDGNPRGRRDATLQFTVDRLPAGATRVRARLRVYAWHDVAARIVARAVPGGLDAVTGPERLTAARTHVLDAVRKGYNEFDVSPAVRANGTYTFALSQETHHTRVYWASRENARADLHPELLLSYEPAARPSTPPTVRPPATTAPAPPVTAPATPSRSRTPSSRPPATTVTPGTTVTATATAPATTAPAPPPIPGTTTAPQGWRLVFGDEFDGAAIDRSKWNLRRNEGRDVDQGCNTDSPRNQFVSDGHLTIRALRETATCSSQTRQYTQGYLDTIGRHSWTYGRFEMRAKSPNQPGASRGLWPAFWLRPDDGGRGEIDVTELPGGDGWYTRSTAGIFYDYSPVKQDARLALPGGGHPGDGFHTYTTEWDADSLRWYIDGHLVWTRDRTTTPWYDEVFHKPYNIRLNFQVGGWLGSPDESTRFPADFVVDYVRVYQR